METTVAVVDDHMEGDTMSDASQEDEDTPPRDIVQSSKLKVTSDLEKSFQLIIPLRSVFVKDGPLGGMIGVDFTLTFWPICSFRCHKFILAARSKMFVFYDMFTANPLMQEFKMEANPYYELGIKKVAQNVLKFMYTGTIDDVPLDSANDHLRIATTYKLEPMEELVQKKLMDSLDSSNCIKYLITSLSDPLLLGLKEKAIKTIVDNLSDLVSLEEWEDLTRSQPSLTTEILRTYFMR